MSLTAAHREANRLEVLGSSGGARGIVAIVFLLPASILILARQRGSEKGKAEPIDVDLKCLLWYTY